LHVDSMPELRPVCPLCDEPLVELSFVGSLDRPPPDGEGEYFLEPDDWIERISCVYLGKVLF